MHLALASDSAIPHTPRDLKKNIPVAGVLDEPRSAELPASLHRLEPGGDSHLEISVIPVLRHSLYTWKYSHGARAWQGFVAIMSM